jgi:hypothetical protein
MQERTLRNVSQDNEITTTGAAKELPSRLDPTKTFVTILYQRVWIL